jgi:hypothetical protein
LKQTHEGSLKRKKNEVMVWEERQGLVFSVKYRGEEENPEPP